MVNNGEINGQIAQRSTYRQRADLTTQNTGFWTRVKAPHCLPPKQAVLYTIWWKVKTINEKTFRPPQHSFLTICHSTSGKLQRLQHNELMNSNKSPWQHVTSLKFYQHSSEGKCAVCSELGFFLRGFFFTDNRQHSGASKLVPVESEPRSDCTPVSHTGLSGPGMEFCLHFVRLRTCVRLSSLKHSSAISQQPTRRIG